MAIEQRDSPLTRDTISRWLDEWKEADPQPDVRIFLAGKINDLELPDTMVNTATHENYEDETPLLEMLIDDLPSYGITDF